MHIACTECKDLIDVTAKNRPITQADGTKRDREYWYETETMGTLHVHVVAKRKPVCATCDTRSLSVYVKPKPNKCKSCGYSTYNRYFCSTCHAKKETSGSDSFSLGGRAWRLTA